MGALDARWEEKSDETWNQKSNSRNGPLKSGESPLSQGSKLCGRKNYRALEVNRCQLLTRKKFNRCPVIAWSNVEMIKISCKKCNVEFHTRNKCYGIRHHPTILDHGIARLGDKCLSLTHLTLSFMPGFHCCSVDKQRPFQMRNLRKNSLPNPPILPHRWWCIPRTRNWWNVLPSSSFPESYN